MVREQRLLKFIDVMGKCIDMCQPQSVDDRRGNTQKYLNSCLSATFAFRGGELAFPHSSKQKAQKYINIANGR